MLIITIVSLVTYAATDSLIISKTDLRVYGDVDDKYEKYPYVVAFKRLDTWVLTAAHCFDPEIKFIQYGNMSQSIAETKSKSVVLKMISHPGRKSLPYWAVDINDIGLVLVQRVNMPKYAHISAVNYRTLVGQSVECAGFGMTYLPKQYIPNHPQTETLDNLRSLQIAEGIVKSFDDIALLNNMMICVASKCSQIQMILPGDSGGPCFIENKIVGVASGYDDDIFEYGFSPVSSYLSWIHSVVSTQQ